MASNLSENLYIDESDEDALLKSDDDLDDNTVVAKKNTKERIFPGSTSKNYNDIENKKLIREVSVKTSENSCSSTDSDYDNKEIEWKIQQLVTELQSEQYCYDKYVQLCNLSHTSGDLETIRGSYTKFARIYPLSPELWERYINVELTIAQSVDEIARVEALYRQALRDYYSCDLALGLAKLAPRCQNPDLIWREILSVYGLHYLRGGEFYELYRKYLERKDESGLQNNSSYKTEWIESYMDQLCIPLHKMEDVFIIFKVWYEKNKSSIEQNVTNFLSVEKRYFEAKKFAQSFLTFEQQLNTLDSKAYREKAEVYFDYIAASEKVPNGNVNKNNEYTHHLTQTLYERMVADCCLNAKCWLLYIGFMINRIKDGVSIDEKHGQNCNSTLRSFVPFNQTADIISERALRNCCWSPELYGKHMQVLELMDKPKQHIQEVLEQALSVGFQNPDNMVQVWLDYLTYLKRHTDWKDENQCEILRKNFNLAWTSLGQQWDVLADCDCEILQFWGNLEYGPLKDPKRGKELWCRVMKSSDNSSKSGLWIEFINLEVTQNLESARRLFIEALNTATLDNPAVIASAWKRFERCNGTSKSLDRCLTQCHTILETIYNNTCKFQQYQTTKYKKETKSLKRRLSPCPNDSIHEAVSQKKYIKTIKKPYHIHSPQKPKVVSEIIKEHENEAIDHTRDHLRIFLSNLDYNISEEEICKQLPELEINSIELIRSANGKSRGFGYVELKNAGEVKKALELDRRILNGRPIFISSVLRDKEQRQKFKYSDTLEPKKLFVKGLPIDITRNELEEIFGAFGQLHDVRLVYHKSGRFKNIAYVEFKEESSAGKALLAIDKMNIREHTISVAVSNPPQRPTQSSSSTKTILKLFHSKADNRNKLYDQKPRMSLIPNVVRRKFSNTSLSTINNQNQIKSDEAKKSNDDFRIMFNFNKK